MIGAANNLHGFRRRNYEYRLSEFNLRVGFYPRLHSCNKNNMRSETHLWLKLKNIQF